MKRELTARLDTPLAPLVVVALAAACFVSGMLRRADFDASRFVTAGDAYCDPARVPPGLSVLRASDGYDGQFYYRLALDPLTSKRADFGVTLDLPPYRQQRVLYPLLAGALSLGDARLLPAALLLVNFLALCSLGWLGGAFARGAGRHALWGIFLPMYPGALLTLSRDLVELTEIALLLAGLLLLRRARYPAAAVLLTLAVLAKETALVALLAVAAVYGFDLLRGRGARARWYCLAAPLAVFCAWQLFVFRNWGELAAHAGSVSVGTPLAGFVGFLAESAALATPLARRSLPELIFLVVFAACVASGLRSASSPAHERLAWALYALLALTLSRAVWIEDWSYLRALSEFCAVGTIILFGGSLRMRAAVFGGSFTFWLFIFLRLLRHGD